LNIPDRTEILRHSLLSVARNGTLQAIFYYRGDIPEKITDKGVNIIVTFSWFDAGIANQVSASFFF
jgi:hypothetical protein